MLQWAWKRDAPLSVDVAEGAFRAIATAVGMIDKADISAFADWKASLRKVSRGVPPVLEVRYRHGIAGREDFIMKPGYSNFQKFRHRDRYMVLSRRRFDHRDPVRIEAAL